MIGTASLGLAGQRCRTAVRWMWERVRRQAGLPNVHIHDLRRTAASWLAINGENLPVIQQMLNHKSLAATQIYARLSVEPVRRALDEQAERMLGPVPVVPSKYNGGAPPPLPTFAQASSGWSGRGEGQHQEKMGNCQGRQYI